MGGFTEADLRVLAGSRSFERGQDYLDAVTALEVGDGWITATVHGTDAYEVELFLDEPEGLTGECDCPYGMEGNFCKHLVALGLTALARSESLPGEYTRARSRVQDLDTWLAALSRDELLALVREQIAEDRQVRRRLELRAASARRGATWLSTTPGRFWSKALLEERRPSAAVHGRPTRWKRTHGVWRVQPALFVPA